MYESNILPRAQRGEKKPSTASSSRPASHLFYVMHWWESGCGLSPGSRSALLLVWPESEGRVGQRWQSGNSIQTSSWVISAVIWRRGGLLRHKQEQLSLLVFFGMGKKCSLDGPDRPSSGGGGGGGWLPHLYLRHSTCGLSCFPAWKRTSATPRTPYMAGRAQRTSWRDIFPF